MYIYIYINMSCTYKYIHIRGGGLGDRDLSACGVDTLGQPLRPRVADQREVLCAHFREEPFRIDLMHGASGASRQRSR